MQLWIKYTELPIWWYTAETARLTQSTLFTLNDWLAIVCSGVEEKCANRFNPSFIHCHSFPAPLDFNQGGCLSSSACTHCIPIIDIIFLRFPNRPRISSKLIHICVVGVDRPLLHQTNALKLYHLASSGPSFTLFPSSSLPTKWRRSTIKSSKSWGMQIIITPSSY